MRWPPSLVSLTYTLSRRSDSSLSEGALSDRTTVYGVRTVNLARGRPTGRVSRRTCSNAFRW
jgi:hypothetical protein